MTGITQPSASQTAPVAAGTSAGTVYTVPADVVSVPPRLSDLPRGIAVAGRVIRSTADGADGALSVVRTQLGEITIRTTLPLPSGPVTIQLPAGSPPTTAAVQLQVGTGDGLETAVRSNAASAISDATPPAAPPLPAGANTAAVRASATAAASAPTVSVLPNALTGKILEVLTLPFSGNDAATAAIPKALAGAATSSASAVAGGQTQQSSQATTTGALLPPALPTGGQALSSAVPAGTQTTPPARLAAATITTQAGNTATALAPSPAVTLTGSVAGIIAAADTATLVPAGTLPTGIAVVRVQSIVPPGSPVAAIAGTVAAEVVGSDASGRPLLLTAIGQTAVLTTQTTLPVGTRLGLEVTTARLTLPPTATTPSQPAAISALAESLAVIARTDDEAARTISNAILAQPNVRLAATLVVLLAAIRAGADARQLLGERGIKALERAGRADLAASLGRDLPDLAQRGPAAGATWDAYHLPFLNQGTVETIVVRVQRRPEQEDKGTSDGEGQQLRPVRFVVDVKLSRLGPVQIDGLARPRRLDIVLRSETPFPETLRADLNDAFRSCLNELNYAGDLIFRQGGWISPIVARSAGTHHTVTA